MSNPKNELLEILQDLGHSIACLKLSYIGRKEGKSTYKATLQLKKVFSIVIEGAAQDSRTAEMNACQNMIDYIKANHASLIIDWSTQFEEAQAGDTLVKLCGYLRKELSNAEAKSRWLQRMETDAHFTKLFDYLYESNDPSVAFFGDNLGAKRKATWIEAMIWRQFKDDILLPDAQKGLNGIYAFLTQK